MVDYDLIDDDILAKLRTLGSLDVKTTIECGYKPYTKDPELIWKGTLEKKRILLTADKNTIKVSTYTPCKHGGIIVIQHPRPTPELVYAYIKVLLLSGQKKFAKKHFTRINKDRLKIITHEQEPVIVEFDSQPNLRKIINRV